MLTTNLIIRETEALLKMNSITIIVIDFHEWSKYKYFKKIYFLEYTSK